MILWKEVVKPGVYFAQGRWVRVRNQDISEWVSNFRKMQDAGLKVPVPYEHPPDTSFGNCPVAGQDADAIYRKHADKAKHNAGWVADMQVRDNALFAKLNIRDEDAKRLQEAGGFVSPHFRQRWTDGNGRTWQNSILHMAVTLHPVNASQSDRFEKEASFSAVNLGDSPGSGCKKASGISEIAFLNFSLCDFCDQGETMTKATMAGAAGTARSSKQVSKNGKPAGNAGFHQGVSFSSDSDSGSEDDSEDDSEGDSSDEGDSSKMADSSDAAKTDPDAERKSLIAKLVSEMATLGVIVPKDIDLKGDITTLLSSIQTHKATKNVSKAESQEASQANSQDAGDGAGGGDSERQVQPVNMSTLSAMSLGDIASAHPGVKSLIADAEESRKAKLMRRVDALVSSGRATIPQAAKLRESIGKHSFSAAVAGSPTSADSELEIRIATLEEIPEKTFPVSAGNSGEASFSADDSGDAAGGDSEQEAAQDPFFNLSGGGEKLSSKEARDTINFMLGRKASQAKT